jgi:uncharacterized transporter YbjL
MCEEHHRSKKVTTSQDDGFVGGVEIQLVGYAEKHEKIEKVTGSELSAQQIYRVTQR